MDNEPTDAMSVAYGLNTDGYVSLIFVRDSDVHFRTVTNWTLSTLNINGVDVPSKGTIQVANGFDLTVKAAGGAALASGSKNLVAWADYDGSSAKDEYLKGDISSTTGAGTITMPANGVVKIGSVVGTEFNPSNEPTETVGGSTTPTGEYTITVYTSQWPDSGSGNKYNFYVNNTKVTNFTQGVGTKSFTVKSTDTVAIDGFTFGSVKNNATVTLATGVTGTVNLAATSVTFKVSSNVTLNDPATVVASATGGDAAVVTPKINTNLTLKTADGTVVSGGTVTKAEINTSNSSKLEISITLPEGYTANTNTATVTYVDSNSISKSIIMTAGSTATGVYTAASNSNESATIGDGKGTLNITLEVSAITTKPVTYKLPSGYTLDGTGTNTLTLDTAAAGNLEFKLMGVPAYAAKVDVSYTVTGTNLDSTKTYTASGLAVSNLQITVPSVKATGDVVVTVTEVKVTDVKAEIKLADGVPASLIAFNGGAKTMTVGSAAKLANMDATLPTNVNKATVSYTVTGATGSKLTGTFDVDSSAASDKGWITDDFTPTGDQAVVVTIDSVTYTEAKNAAINTTALGTVDTDRTITVGVKTVFSIKLQKSGDTYTNAEALTITLTPSKAWSADSVKIQLSGATNGSIADSANVVSTATGGADSNPVEITFQAGELTFNDLSKTIQFVVEDNP